MFRSLFSFAVIAAACCAGAASAAAGGLEALRQGGYASGQAEEIWAQRSDENHYRPAGDATCLFRVRYYKLNWQHKKHATFGTFADAKLFLLRMKMKGYYANLSIHELHRRPKKSAYWLP